jgi:hypothetical protein
MNSFLLNRGLGWREYVRTVFPAEKIVSIRRGLNKKKYLLMPAPNIILTIQWYGCDRMLVTHQFGIVTIAKLHISQYNNSILF